MTSDAKSIVGVLQRLKIGNTDTEIYPEPLEKRKREKRYKIEFGSNSTFVTFTHLVRAMLGPTILAIPRGFKLGGYAFSAIGFASLLVLVTYNMRRLILNAAYLSERENLSVRTYDDVAFVAFNTCSPKTKAFAMPLKIIVNLLFFITYLDACVIFMIFMASNLEAIVHNYSPQTYLDVRYFLFFQVILLLCMSTVRSLKRLSPFSLIASLLLIIVVLVIVSCYFTKHPAPFSERKAIGQFRKVVHFICICLFCLSGISIALTLKSSMKYPEKFMSCPAIFYISVALIGILFITFGLLGYLKFGVHTKPSILLNLPFDSPLSVCVKMFAIVSVFCTCPLVFYVAFNVLWSNFLKNHFGTFNILFIEYFVRQCLIIVCFITAIIIPNLGAMIVLKGALFHSHLELTIPPILDFVTYYPQMGFGKWYHRLYWPIFTTLFGLVTFIGGVVMSIVDWDFT